MFYCRLSTLNVGCLGVTASQSDSSFFDFSHMNFAKSSDFTFTYFMAITILYGRDDVVFSFRLS